MTSTHRYPVKSHQDRRNLARRLGLAIVHQYPVTVEYTRQDGTTTLRTVEPYQVDLSKANKLIVQVMDRKSRDPRSLRFDRISGYTIHHTKPELLEYK